LYFVLRISDLPLLPNDPPTSAYFHVPFCRHRCGYCNFTLVAGRDDLIGSYLQAIELELARLPRQYALDTLYFGGGTPTHLPAVDLARLFALVRRWFQLNPGAEVTVEANPLDLDPQRCAALRDAGVNRISLGVQSFRDAKLAVLERDHRRCDIAHAIELARGAAASVSLDLIYAAPGESLAQWLDDLSEAVATGVDHVSVYGLTIEQGSAFYGRWLKGTLAKAPEPLEADMYEAALDRLAAGGYQQYEASNFARPGEESRHNETYWQGRSYFAFGPGAARYVHGRREVNHRSTTAYLQRLLAGQSPVAEAEELSPEDRARERLVFGLRRLAGVERQQFLAETGYEIEGLAGKQLASLVDLGLLRWSEQRLQLTRRGLLLSDSIWPKLL
jgi:oxygen-independent coproporphyrinogen-3 oxidase